MKAAPKSSCWKRAARFLRRSSSPTSGLTSCPIVDFEVRSKRPSTRGIFPNPSLMSIPTMSESTGCVSWGAEPCTGTPLRLRYAPRDFKEWSLQGIEEDWPLSYEELEPYYDRIEQIIGVCGNDDHLEILPAGKHYLPPIPWRCSEHIMNRATSAMGIPLIAVRKAVLTRPYDDRPACHYCGHCMDGCDVASIFTTPDCMLPKARATGNFTLRQNALAREILVDREGLARAVSFIDTETRSRTAG